jgi:alanyl-tRNA synthetase
MTGDEVRQAFLRFFEEKGHKVIPSSSLIPHGDPTLLFTSAGMVPFKPYFLGEEAPPRPRLASVQKCFRTTDIESVGDSSHLTFFEMLGNFSIGDYFKKEAISWAWQFVTRQLGLPPERLWITIFLDDDESFGIWRKQGVPEERILRFGEQENYWGPAGDSGPCGPCSEIHYDFGPGVGCGRPSCAPNCDCGRFSEIWNLVFVQYNQDSAGNRSLLPKPSVDTGMGLERTAAVMQGKTSVYDTDLFASLLDNISKYIGKKYGSDNEVDKAMRVVVEHGRALTFLIADGVRPSNEGRGYVLRRLLRRAALFGRRLGLEKPFLNQIAGATVGSMAKVYPELQQWQDDIYRVVGTEEAQFRETLNTGLELLDDIIAKPSSQVRNSITGKEAFKLYDTYGFPIELTREIARGRGFSVDEEGFEKEMEKQRARARASHKFELAKAVWQGKLKLKATSFVGYRDLKQKSVILDLLVDNESVVTVEEGQQASIILDKTPFYAEKGGQVGDSGLISAASGSFTVTNTVRVVQVLIAHQGRVTGGSLALGDEVEAEVDEERRFDIARNHTATHLLQFALRQVVGSHVEQRGSLVAPDRLRFDFSHLSAMTKEEIDEIQRIVNREVRHNLPVHDREIPYRQAIDEGAIALFDEKYGDSVRVLVIGKPPLSIELCGGTHVAATGEIGFFHIIGESGIGAGLRRIEAVTGRGAEELVDRRLSELQETAEYLDAELDDVLDKMSSFVTQLNWERKQVRVLENVLAKIRAESLASQTEVVNGIKLVAQPVPSASIETLRELSDHLRRDIKSGIIVLGTVYEDRPIFLAAVTPDLVKKGYHAGEIIKKVAGITGGSGGGKATLAQGGGKDKSKLDAAIALVESLIIDKTGGGKQRAS